MMMMLMIMYDPVSSIGMSSIVWTLSPDENPAHKDIKS